MTSFGERLQLMNPENKESEFRIFNSTNSVLVEITEKCYTGCEHCYKGSIVSTKGNAVPVDILEKRFEWISRYTDVNNITLLGGEPLLHPNLPEIVDSLHEKGFIVRFITSGKISKDPVEQRNYEYLLNQYEKGKVEIELSYQPERNEKSFEQMYSDLISKALLRRKEIKKRRRQYEKQNPVRFSKQIQYLKDQAKAPIFFSSVTIPEYCGESYDRFEKVFDFLLRCGGRTIGACNIGEKNTPIAEYIHSQFEHFKLHFKPFGEATMYASDVNYVDKKFDNILHDLKVQFRLWGPVRFSRDSETGRAIVSKPPGTVDDDTICPAMTCVVGDLKHSITASNLTIRSDGELCFSTPSCIATPVGLLNVDTDVDTMTIYRHAKARINATQNSIRNAMRERAKSTLYYCKTDISYPTDEDAKNRKCPSCPYDVSCNTCQSITTADRKILYESNMQ